MSKIVRILGTASNLAEMPPSNGVEVWPSNFHRTYYKRLPRLFYNDEWTRWFNIHSRHHMDTTYPNGVLWYKSHDGSRPIYTQISQPDIPGNVVFPGPTIQRLFALPDGSPNRFFTCSATWLIALAIMEGFEKIELWGFELKDKLRDGMCYEFERPCFFYWVQQARDRNIDVWYPDAVQRLPYNPGDPSTYDGPLYGYETKPEL